MPDPDDRFYRPAAAPVKGSEPAIHDESPQPYDVSSEEFARVRREIEAEDLLPHTAKLRMLATIDLLRAERDGARKYARELRDKGVR